MVCCKPIHQVIRNAESVLAKINLVRDIGIDRGIDYKAEIHTLITSQHIITSYNKRVYRIDEVAWDKTPESTFCIEKDGEEFHLSFFDYLKLRHKIELTNLG
jgi:aubergine-like protein